MLGLIKRTRDLLLDDATIVSYVGNKVYMSLKPIVNTDNSYPQICISVDDGGNYSFLNVYRSDVYIYIYTKGDGAQTTNGLILKRVLQVLNQQRYAAADASFKVYRYNKEYAVTNFDDEYQVYRTDLKLEAICQGD